MNNSKKTVMKVATMGALSFVAGTAQAEPEDLKDAQIAESEIDAFLQKISASGNEHEKPDAEADQGVVSFVHD